MRAAELLFRHKILAFLKDEGLISEERIKLLLSWRNSGFSVDCSVRIQTGDTKALERVARYILRPPFSLERLSWDKATDQVSYTAKVGSSPSSQTKHFDPSISSLASSCMCLSPGFIRLVSMASTRASHEESAAPKRRCGSGPSRRPQTRTPHLKSADG